MARTVRDVVIYVHGAVAPSDTEWEAVLDVYRQAAFPSRLRTLVYTEGGAPNPKQRARLSAEAFAGKAPIAVLTTSALARAAGIALGWFNPRIRIYGPGQIDRALDHLLVPTEDRGAVREALGELRQQLSDGAGASPA